MLDQLEADIRAFRASDVITDQYGGHFVTQDLNRRLLGHVHGGHQPVRVKPRTRDRNQTTASIFREAVTLRQVHSYPDDQLRRELLFLQETAGKVEAPTSGPVQTDDVAVVTTVLVEELLGPAAAQPVIDRLRNTLVSGAPGPGQTAEDRDTFRRLSEGVRSRRPDGTRAYPGGPRQIPRWVDPSRTIR